MSDLFNWFFVFVTFTLCYLLHETWKFMNLVWLGDWLGWKVELPWWSRSICFQMQLIDLKFHFGMEKFWQSYSAYFTSVNSELCSSEQVKASSWKPTMKIKAEDTPFSCPQCDLSFKMKKNLKMHIIQHGGNKSHSCNLCSNSTTSACKLKKNMLVLLGQILSAILWKYTVEKSQKNATNVTMHPLWHAI